MSALMIRESKGGGSIRLGIYAALVISAGLGAVSLGEVGGGNLRLWEVLLFAFALATCAGALVRRQIILSFSPLLVLVGGYVAAVMLSGMNAADSAIWWQRVILVLAMTLLFFVMSQRSTQKEFDLYSNLVIYSGVFFGFLGILDVLLFTSAPNVFEFIHQWDGGRQFSGEGVNELASYDSTSRTRGFFTESNEFSQYLSLPFGFLLAAIFFKHRKAGSKLVYLYGIAIVLLAQVMTLSRGGLVCFFAELLGLLLVKKLSDVRWKIRAGNYLTIALVAISLAVGGMSYVGEDVAAAFEAAAFRVHSTGTSDDWTSEIKLGNYQEALNSAAESVENLLVGIGAGNLYNSSVAEATTTNQFMDVLIEMGIIGSVFYVSIALSLLWQSYKFLKSGLWKSSNKLFVVFVGAFVSFLGMLIGGMTYPTHMLFFFWLNAGLLSAICRYGVANRPARQGEVLRRRTI